VELQRDGLTSAAVRRHHLGAGKAASLPLGKLKWRLAGANGCNDPTGLTTTLAKLRNVWRRRIRIFFCGPQVLFYSFERGS